MNCASQPPSAAARRGSREALEGDAQPDCPFGIGADGCVAGRARYGGYAAADGRRARGGKSLSGSHQSDAYLGWSGKPNLRLHFRRPEFDALVEHDAEGWRQPKPPRPAVPTSRILVLGDSFTWGWGVSQGQVFTDLLQAALPATVAVYNHGIPGFGTAQEYLLLQRELAARVYDAVVLMFYMNDLSDNISSRQGRRPYFEATCVRATNPPGR